MDGFLDPVSRALEFFLEPGDKIAWSILKEDDEAEGKNDKQDEPKQTADQSHGRRLMDCLPTVNDP